MLSSRLLEFHLVLFEKRPGLLQVDGELLPLLGQSQQRRFQLRRSRARRQFGTTHRAQAALFWIARHWSRPHKRDKKCYGLAAPSVCRVSDLKATKLRKTPAAADAVV